MVIAIKSNKNNTFYICMFIVFGSWKIDYVHFNLMCVMSKSSGTTGCTSRHTYVAGGKLQKANAGLSISQVTWNTVIHMPNINRVTKKTSGKYGHTRTSHKLLRKKTATIDRQKDRAREEMGESIKADYQEEKTQNSEHKNTEKGRRQGRIKCESKLKKRKVNINSIQLTFFDDSLRYR